MVAHKKNPVPALTAVNGPEHSSLLIGRPEVPQRGHEHDIRVRRVNEDLADVMRVMEAHVLPGQPGICGSEDSGP